VRRRTGERIHGPYQHGNRWRIIVVSGEGARRPISAATRAEAETAKASLLKEISGRTMRDAMVDYLAAGKARGLAKATTDRAEFHLKRFFSLKAGEGGMLRDLTPSKLKAIYDAQSKASKADTHRNGLSEVKAFLGWCVEQGWLRANPAAKVKPIGRRNKGKEQLRLTEARAFTAYCLERAAGAPARVVVEPGRACRPTVPSTSEGALGVLCAFYLDCRASEIVERPARDIDDEGRLFWIPKAKTPAGRRHLSVPDVLAPLLADAARGKRSDERVFRMTRHDLLRECHRLCREAGVTIVSLHGLRGSGASIAAEHGASIKAISEAMGHTRESVTRGHYVRQDAAAAGQQKRLLAAMAGN
jgi:integrase